MKILITLLFACLFAFTSYCQAPPQGINYQAVAYDFNRTSTPGIDMNFQPAANRDIRVRFTIISQNLGGQTVYRESHETTTDIGGLFNLVIGIGTLDSSPNSFNNINWGAGLHFLKVEIDPRGGFDYQEMSTQQLWSVPYALYASSSGNNILNVTDNGDGTLTIYFTDSTSYTTPVLTGLQGPQGTQGPKGAQGPQGIQGPAGAAGAGISGSFVQNDSLYIQLNNGQIITVGAVVGPQGPAGTDGIGISNSYVQNDSLFIVMSNGQLIGVGSVVGPQGPSGTTGPQGPAGTNGTGINSSYVQNDSLFLVLSNGQTISVGAVVGPQGPTGAIGPQGIQGPAGPQGPQGIIGLTGPQGPIGPQGNTGLTGPQGPIGPQGLTGTTGTQGPAGANGVSVINSFVLGDSLYVQLSNGQTLNTGYVRGPQGFTNSIAANITSLDTASWNAAGNDWKLTGNAGTNASTNFVGTTDARDLVFRTNNSEKIRVTSSGNIGIGTASPDSSALTEMQSVTQGFLPPRMTSTQRDAISSPSNGLMIFNITTGCPNYFYSGLWYEWCGSAILPI
jgi:hypothetical protein